MNERKVILTLGDAIALDKLGGMGSVIAHAAFSKDELELNDIPKTYSEWESLSDGDVFRYDLKGDLTKSSSKDMVPSHLCFGSLDQISGIEALIKLENLASYYRKYHKENLQSIRVPNAGKYYIGKLYTTASTVPKFSVVESHIMEDHILWFPSKSLAESFLDSFKDLILTAKNYIY